MDRCIRGLLVLLGVLLPMAGEAREVSVAIGFSIPPYVIAEERRGIEYDIVKESLASEGFEMVPHFVPLGRVIKEIDAGQAEAAMTQRLETGIKAHFSDVYITYHNFAITLASRNIAVESMADLGDKSVLAFQNASLYLGPEFKAAAAADPHYREEARQMAQPLLLYLGRVDVVIADRNIFSWFAQQPEVQAKTDTRQAIRFHPLFPPTDYRMAFRDADLRDHFNRGLATLHRTGAYDRIVRRYAPLLNEGER